MTNLPDFYLNQPYDIYLSLNQEERTHETFQNKDAASSQEPIVPSEETIVSSEETKAYILELFPDLFPTHEENIKNPNDDLNQKTLRVINSQGGGEKPINIIFTNNSQSLDNASNETANSPVLKPLNNKLKRFLRKHEQFTKSNLESIVNKIKGYPEEMQEKILRGRNKKPKDIDLDINKCRKTLSKCVKARLLLFCAKLKNVPSLNPNELRVWKELIVNDSDKMYVLNVLNGNVSFNLTFFSKFIKQKEIEAYLEPFSEILKTGYSFKNQNPRYGGNSSINLDHPDAANQSKLFLPGVPNPYVFGEQQIYPNISLDPFGGQGSSQTTTTTDPTSLTDDFQSWQDLF